MKKIKTIIALMVALAALGAFADDSAPFFLNTAKGTRFQKKTELISYSTEWDKGSSVRVTADGATLKEAVAPASGDVAWDGAKASLGLHTLTHVSGGKTLTAQFAVLDDDVVVHSGVLKSSEIWDANKIHLVTGAITIPSGVSLTINSGAVVKFMPGMSISVINGGSCTASGVIFTHVNDDTIGGDTMMDKDSAVPKMGEYTITGNIIDDDATEYRYSPPQTLTSNISSDTRLRGYRTYIVSNSVTVASGAKLTLQPGTILKFNSGCSLMVNGTLDAKGTRAAPIVFTSLKDDEYGGDTNEDGDATLPAGGDWNKISVNGVARLVHCVAQYGAPRNESGIVETRGSGVLSIDSSLIAHAKYDGIWNWGGKISVTNTVVTDTGWATAPYQGSKNEYVNCIFIGNNVGLCYWSHWNGKPSYVNCIFTECGHGWCETASGRYADPPSAVKINNCLFWDPAEFGAQSSGRVGSNGNIWGDPLFVDPDNGDFRIKEGSPCMDAADTAVAPSTDYYGQPRVTLTPGATNVLPLADIGISEVMPRNIASDIDLVPENVTSSTNVASGQSIVIKWTVRNNGGKSVDYSWRDTISLVSENGREVVLGEKVTTAYIAAGGSASCSASFVVPAISEGEWYPKVNVNSYRDVFEGALGVNNALVGDRALTVMAEAFDPSVAREGVIGGGTPSVIKLTFGADDENRMVKFDVPAGVKVTWGFGFMPQGASQSGSMTATDGGVMFRVPEGATDVYVVLESDKTATYEMSTESTKMVITGVTPNTLPSSGTTTLVITGAGFGETNVVILASDSVGRVVLNAPQKDASGNLIATVDCSTLTAGATYGVRVESGEKAAELDSAVTVTKAEGKGGFWMQLINPELVRGGRSYVCKVQYGNSGTADIPAQILQIMLQGEGADIVNGDSLSYIGESSRSDKLQFIAAGFSSTPGIIRANETNSIQFVYNVGKASEERKNIVVRSSWEKAEYPVEGNWSNSSEYLKSLSTAVNRVATTYGNSCDFIHAYNFALRDMSQITFSVVAGNLVDINGNPMKQKEILLCGTNKVYSATTDINGRFVFDDVAAGDYIVRGGNCALMDNIVITVYVGSDKTNLRCVISEKLCAEIKVSGFSEPYEVNLKAKDSRERLSLQKVEENYYKIFGIPDGMYVIEVIGNSGEYWNSCYNYVSSVGDVAYYVASPKNKWSIEGTVEGLDDSQNCLVILTGSVDERSCATDAFGSFSFEDLPEGIYCLSVCYQSGIELACKSFEVFYLDSNVTQELSIMDNGVSNLNLSQKAVNVGAVNNNVNGSMSSYSKKSYYWFDPDAPMKMFQDYVNECRALKRRFSVPCPPSVDYDCPHNREKYQLDKYAWDSLEDNMNNVQAALITVSGYKFLANTFKFSHEWLNLTYDLCIALCTGGKQKVFQAAVKDLAVGMASITKDQINEAIREAGEGDEISDSDWQLFITEVDILASSYGNADMIATSAKTFQYVIQKINGKRCYSHFNGQTAQFFSKVTNALTLCNDFLKVLDAAKDFWNSRNELQDAMDNMEILMLKLGYSRGSFEGRAPNFNRYPLCCKQCFPETPYPPPGQEGGSGTVISNDPNEMAGPRGLGDPNTERFVKPGEWMTYTVYFENMTNATAAAQEVYVTNPLSEWLDWSTFEMGEVSFGNQIDLGLSGKSSGSTEKRMDGTNWIVRTELSIEPDTTALDSNRQQKMCAKWYLRIVDPSTDTGWPNDPVAGFLPPNNPDTHCGEGHLTYRIKLRDDAPGNIVITNSATIVFDYNEPITTDPAWWNTVAPTEGMAKFSEADILAEEGANVTFSVFGGNAYNTSSVKLYLTYNTASAADVYLKNGTVDSSTGGSPVPNAQAARSTNLKFPLTLSWAAGEIGEKTISIPVLADKAVEDVEQFTLQLGDPVGMELGETRLCTVTITDPSYAELEAKIAAGTATKAEQTAWDKLQKAKAPYIRGVADPANAGKVTGSGLCASGKKVTLKAAANKGYAFTGWLKEQIALDGDRLVTNAVEYIATTPSLVIDRTAKPAKDTATSTTLTDINDNATFYAAFITTDEDKAAVGLTLNGGEVPQVEDNAPSLVTNIMCGVALNWPLASSALSATTVKVAGLPAGLKFTSKDIMKKGSKTEVEIPANTIYGVPTAASKIDKKTGLPVPSAVKVTVTTAGKSSVTYLMNITVDALPDWAVGTFNGGGDIGQVSLTIAKTGKLSGKYLSDGLTWSLAANSFDSIDESGEVYRATLIGKSGKLAMTNEVGVTCDSMGGYAESIDYIAYQNNWKLEPWKTIGKPFAKVAALEYEDSASVAGVSVPGVLTLKFTASGAVTVKGSFVTGVNERSGKDILYSASGSAVLAPQGEPDETGVFDAVVFVYLQPKAGKFDGYIRCIAVRWTGDGWIIKSE